MKALIRKAFSYGSREMVVGAVEEIGDAAFAEFKRDRLVTEAPVVDVDGGFLVPADDAVLMEKFIDRVSDTAAEHSRLASPEAQPAKSIASRLRGALKPTT